MGHKVTLNRPFDSGSELQYPCPECGKPMFLLSHLFRPPKKTDDKKWKTVNIPAKRSVGFGYLKDPTAIFQPDNTPLFWQMILT